MAAEPATAASAALRDRPRLAVVSALAHRPFGPRSVRTRRLVEALERSWEVELFAQPHREAPQPAAKQARTSPLRRKANQAVRTVMLDRWEPWSRRTFWRWRADVDAALLIGFPFSPLIMASRRLARARVPYVVDTGDPWTLTSRYREGTLIGLRRSLHAERRLWEGAAGAVLTTPQQARPLSALFPELPLLVRPNGYTPVADLSHARASADRSHLRLVHFGQITTHRVDVSPFLAALSSSGRWRRISFAQYGGDFSDMLDRAPAGVEVERHPSRPWEECVQAAGEHDLAVVLGNVSPDQLPSKAIEYLTLPIPRLALTHRSGDDALTDYVRGRPGWLALPEGEADVGALVAEHLARDWSAVELRPAAEEGWPHVARQVVSFLEGCVGVPSSARAPARAEPAGATAAAEAPG